MAVNLMCQKQNYSTWTELIRGGLYGVALVAVNLSTNHIYGLIKHVEGIEGGW